MVYNLEDSNTIFGSNEKQHAITSKDLDISPIMNDLLKISIASELCFEQITIFGTFEDFKSLKLDMASIKLMMTSGTKICDAIIFLGVNRKKRERFEFKKGEKEEVDVPKAFKSLISAFYIYLFTNNSLPDDIKIIPAFVRKFMIVESLEQYKELANNLTTANLNYVLDIFLRETDFSIITDGILRNRIRLGIAGHRLPRAVKLFVNPTDITDINQREFMSNFISRLDLRETYKKLHNTFKSNTLKDTVSINRMCEHMLIKNLGKKTIEELVERKIIFKKPNAMPEIEFNESWSKLKSEVESILSSKIEFEKGKEGDSEEKLE